MKPNAHKALVYPIYYITITHLTHNSTEEFLHPNVITVSLPSVSIKIVTRPLSTMGQYACTMESMVSYHYPSPHRRQDIVNSQLYSTDAIELYGTPQ